MRFVALRVNSSRWKKSLKRQWEKNNTYFPVTKVTQRQLCHNDRVKKGLTDEYKI